MGKMTSLAIASLLVVGGCSKKKEEATQQRAGEGKVVAAPPAPAVATPAAAKPLVGKELADAYLKCVAHINEGKLDAFRAECVDASYKLHDHGSGAERDLDAMMAWFGSMRSAMPDWKLQPQLVMVSGRNVLSMVLATGTHTAPLVSPQGTVPATNKKMGVLLVHRLAINEANKATEEWGYSDPLTVQAQLGIAPKGTPPKRAAIEQPVVEGAPVVVVSVDNQTENQNLEVVRQQTAAVNAKKVEQLRPLLDNNVVESYMHTDKDAMGATQVELAAEDMLTAYKNATVTTDSMYAAGDWVIRLGSFSGTYTKGNTDVRVPVADVMRFQDKKEVRMWHFHSGLVVATQVGALPAAPGAGSASK